MKNVLRTVGYGAAAAFGYLLGVKIFNDVSDPYKRAKIKKKVKRIFKKED